MSQENVERFRVFVEDFLAGSSEPDREAMLTRLAALWDPDIEWDISEIPLLDLVPVGRGRDAMRQWWGEFLEAWESARFPEYELVDAGDRVVLLLDQRMRGRSTGIEVAMGISAHVATFKDGLIVHWKVYASKPNALKAVGLAE
jgi:ketosteroid isomerase-like protein